MQHKHIAVKWQWRGFGTSAMPQSHFCFANTFGVSHEPLVVKASLRGAAHASDYKLVGYSAQGKLSAPKITQRHWRVCQHVVVGCGVAAVAACIHRNGLQGSRNSPCRAVCLRRLGDDQALCCSGLTSNAQAQAGGVKKAPGLVQEGRSHRGIKGIHRKTYHQRCAGVGADHPLIFTALLNRACTAALRGLKAL